MILTRDSLPTFTEIRFFTDFLWSLSAFSWISSRGPAWRPLLLSALYDEYGKPLAGPAVLNYSNDWRMTLRIICGLLLSIKVCSDSLPELCWFWSFFFLMTTEKNWSLFVRMNRRLTAIRCISLSAYALRASYSPFTVLSLNFLGFVSAS